MDKSLINSQIHYRCESKTGNRTLGRKNTTFNGKTTDTRWECPHVSKVGSGLVVHEDVPTAKFLVFHSGILLHSFLL